MEAPRDASRRKFLSGAALAGVTLGAARIFSGNSYAAAGTNAAAIRGSASSSSPAIGRTLPMQTVLQNQPEIPNQEAWQIHPFSLSEIDMGDSVYMRGHSHALALARAYSVDRILAVFRRNAGLDVGSARPPGGWEEDGRGPDEQRWGPGECKKGQEERGGGG